MALILTGLPLNGFAQSDTVTNKKEQTHSLYAGFDYGSNLIYLGTTISGDLPYYTPSLTYGFKDKLFFSASATHVNNTNPYIAFISMSASYNKAVNDWFDYSASISYFKTAESLQETLFHTFGLINFTSGFDWKLLYTKLSFSGVMSESSSGYIQIRNSRYFQTGQFFRKKAFLSFDPNFSFLFGRLVEIETANGASKFANAPPFVQAKKNHNNTTTTYSYRFGMMDTEFSLPVTLNFTKFSLQAETLYILPVNSTPGYSSAKGFSLNISAYFKIF
jgi:hypothetical protein